jgi:hypothetical protein
MILLREWYLIGIMFEEYMFEERLVANCVLKASVSVRRIYIYFSAIFKTTSCADKNSKRQSLIDS